MPGPAERIISHVFQLFGGDTEIKSPSHEMNNRQIKKRGYKTDQAIEGNYCQGGLQDPKRIRCDSLTQNATDVVLSRLNVQDQRRAIGSGSRFVGQTQITNILAVLEITASLERQFISCQLRLRGNKLQKLSYSVITLCMNRSESVAVCVLEGGRKEAIN
ncbi:hypothetical protein BGZ63DRAFT_212031 [Mariannaea sp. PMI_226]|nr:hypothetical protein BGZ63DRAFT_212031 [Mariannaea sp. PMI_226]